MIECLHSQETDDIVSNQIVFLFMKVLEAENSF